MKRLAILLVPLLIYNSSLIINSYASFENQSGGARPQSLGGAFTGLADSGDTMVYNPAGLGRLSRFEIRGGFSRLHVGLDDNSNISLNSFSIVFPLKKEGEQKFGVLGAAVSMLTLAGLYSESNAGLYYGKYVGTNFLIGFGVKYLGISYGRDEYTSLNPVFSESMEKWHYSADAGILYTANDNFSAGMSVRDASEPDMGIKYEDKIARNITLGCAYRHSGYNISSDLSAASNNNITFSAGGEKWFLDNSLAARIGIGLGSKRYSRLHTGLGYEGESVLVDYAFYYPLSGLNDTYGTHLITMGYKFGLPRRENTAKAAKIYEQALADIGIGAFTRSLEKLQYAAKLEPTDKKIALAKERMEQVTVYIKELPGENKYKSAIENGIVKYVAGDDVREAVKLLAYAYSLSPEYENIDKLVKIIAKENNIKLDEGAKTWNIAEQKVYQALDRFKEKKYDESIRLCEEALSLEPNNVMAYKRLGSTFFVLKDMENAKKNWLKAIELAPNDPDIQQIKELLKNIK